MNPQKVGCVQRKHRKEAFGRSCFESPACGLPSQTITTTTFYLKYLQERKAHVFLWHTKQCCGRRKSNSAKEPGGSESFSVSGTHRGEWSFQHTVGHSHWISLTRKSKHILCLSPGELNICTGCKHEAHPSPTLFLLPVLWGFQHGFLWGPWCSVSGRGGHPQSAPCCAPLSW